MKRYKQFVLFKSMFYISKFDVSHTNNIKSILLKMSRFTTKTKEELKIVLYKYKNSEKDTIVKYGEINTWNTFL